MMRIALLTLAALLLTACPEQPHGQRVIMPPPGLAMRVVEAGSTVARDVLWRESVTVTASGDAICALAYTLDGELLGTELDPGGSLTVYGYPGPVTCRPRSPGQVTVWVKER
jgi:hypothetical protein